jgi:alkylation response protein AidB-like acyl-CoA dehydrogenase
MSAQHKTQASWEVEDVCIFREAMRRFIREEFAPQQDQWRSQHAPERSAWRRAGEVGMLLPDLPVGHGGGGTFAHACVVHEELARAGVCFGAGVQNIVGHYIHTYGTEGQKERWLPRLASGELVASIAMTEPAAGSDLAGMKTTATLEGDQYVINGSKTFITNAWHAGLVCVAARTNPTGSPMRAISMILVETQDLAGYSVGRPIEKMGRQGVDTCDVFFDHVRVPAANRLGSVPGLGFSQMLQQLPFERLTLAAGALATAEEAVAMTLRYVRERAAFGKTLFDLQNTRFKLAECATATRVARAFFDQCVLRYIEGDIDDVACAMAKYWMTDLECRIVDECVQLHGGYGYTAEYAISRMWADSRVERIYGGANEVMKDLIASSL